MKVLQVHNRYRKLGGEDTVLANEARLLTEHGHSVSLLDVQNPSADPRGLANKLGLAASMVWSRTGVAAMKAALDKHRPDVVHVHNTFNALSPAVLREASSRGIAVVQTLHNFRLTCANGLLLRDGRPCELCVDQGRFNAVRHACYRDNPLASAAVIGTGALHLRLGTFSARGVRLVALTEFARAIFLRAGASERVLRVKPNFVFPAKPMQVERSNRIVFVGRLTAEKGVDLLLDAWRLAAPPGWTLQLIGEGDLSDAARAAGPSVEVLGWLQPDDVLARVAAARYAVMASRWYETFGMVILEAFSVATPVIAARLGAMAELVTDGVTGMHFEAGDAQSLAAVLRRAAAQPGAEWQRYSEAAYQAHTQRYSPEDNYRQLLDIYRDAMAEVAS